MNKRSLVENSVLIALAAVFLWICIIRHSPDYETIITSDTKGYYMYLPALFVFQDIHHIPDKTFVGITKNDKGEVYTKFSCGNAYFYLPFFLVAHAWAHIFHYPVTGFSPPYCFALMICGVFWAFTGLFILKKLLLQYFSPAVTWITLLAIMLGTNFFNYATFEVGMSHVYNFTLFASIILTTDHYLRAPRRGLAILIGILAAWIILSRPTNAALLLFLFLYRVTTFEELKERWRLLKQHIRHFLWAAPFCLLVILPQLLYWKEMTGHWITYSYTSERFIYWQHPKIAEVLFDTQNGLFIYSPALLFMFWALIARRKDHRISLLGLGCVFAIITYLFASWHAWWFGGAFGHRCYVDYYPLFAFPMAVTFERILAVKRKLVMIPYFLVLILFCYYTIYLSELYMTVGVFDGPNWRWNWETWANLVKMIF